MPIYEYRCLGCETQFEQLLLRATDEARCPSCDETDLERIISPPSLKTCDGFTSPEGYITKSEQKLGLNE
ncbi:zinc ribbon domain-containing protein [Nitrospinae bacterium AH_259_B05_G02_I21]|nr:zinc ribbon domain-containing protein [Nitrospinae bacterium AH_259_B05_G02_I21]